MVLTRRRNNIINEITVQLLQEPCNDRGNSKQANVKRLPRSCDLTHFKLHSVRLC